MEQREHENTPILKVEGLKSITRSKGASSPTKSAR